MSNIRSTLKGQRRFKNYLQSRTFREIFFEPSRIPKKILEFYVSNQNSDKLIRILVEFRQNSMKIPEFYSVIKNSGSHINKFQESVNDRKEFELTNQNSRRI